MKTKTEQNLQNAYRELVKYQGRIERYENDLKDATKKYENERIEHWNAAKAVGGFWVNFISDTIEESSILGAAALFVFVPLGAVTAGIAAVGDIVASPFIAGSNKKKKVECNKLQKLANDANEMLPRTIEKLEEAVKQAIMEGSEIKIAPAYSGISWENKPSFKKAEVEIGGVSVNYKLFNKCLVDLGAVRIPGQAIPLDGLIETAASEIAQKGDKVAPKVFTLPSLEPTQPEQND